jgi:hypothetical protein
MGTGTRFGPVVDGHSLPRDPFDPDAPDVPADVPKIIGTTETEGSYFAPPDLLSLDEAAVRARLKERLAGDGDRIYDLFKKSRPKATPSEIYCTISAFPGNAQIQAGRKAAQRQAPAIVYQIRWRTPVESEPSRDPEVAGLQRDRTFEDAHQQRVDGEGRSGPRRATRPCAAPASPDVLKGPCRLRRRPGGSGRTGRASYCCPAAILHVILR